MKVLSIGSDRKLFQAGSAVQERIRAQAKHMEELHIIVFTTKARTYVPLVLDNVFIYPTDSVSRWLYVWDAIRLGKKLVSSFHFPIADAVVTAQDPFESGLAAARIARALHLPLHVQIHTDFLNSHFKTSLFQSPLQYIRLCIARYVLPRANAVRVVSERIADSITQAGIRLRQSPVILPIRVDSEAIERAVSGPASDLHVLFPQFSCIIFMACRLSPEKRITDALHAFARLAETTHDRLSVGAGLVIAGDGPERSRLEKKAQELGIGETVVFIGMRNDIPQLLKSADVFLSTSQFEGYGMSIVEAALAHCPVVVTDSGIALQKGGKGIIQDGVNGLVCPVGDRACIADGIVWMVKNIAERRVFAERLAVDMKATIPSQEEYIEKYIRNLESAIENFRKFPK